LLYILSANVPFKPNISKLSEKIGITRNTLLQYIHYLEKAKLINTLETAGKSVSILQKPDKIFLENTNLNYTLSPGNADKGSIREAFFLNQVKNAKNTVHLPDAGDFLINGQYTIEVGGKDKAFKQTNNISQSYIAADDIETGFGNKIPLWLFGMMY
jgi:predicted AAA+ superfamily ATPase